MTEIASGVCIDQVVADLQRADGVVGLVDDAGRVGVDHVAADHDGGGDVGAAGDVDAVAGIVVQAIVGDRARAAGVDAVLAAVDDVLGRRCQTSQLDAIGRGFAIHDVAVDADRAVGIDAAVGAVVVDQVAVAIGQRGVADHRLRAGIGDVEAANPVAEDRAAGHVHAAGDVEVDAPAFVAAEGAADRADRAVDVQPVRGAHVAGLIQVLRRAAVGDVGAGEAARHGAGDVDASEAAVADRQPNQIGHGGTGVDPHAFRRHVGDRQVSGGECGAVLHIDATARAGQRQVVDGDIVGVLELDQVDWIARDRRCEDRRGRGSGRPLHGEALIDAQAVIQAARHLERVDQVVGAGSDEDGIARRQCVVAQHVVRVGQRLTG
jgi:hypothetical protein